MESPQKPCHVFLECEIYSGLTQKGREQGKAGEIIFLQKQDDCIIRSKQDTSFYKLKTRLQGDLCCDWLCSSLVLKGESEENQ